MAHRHQNIVLALGLCCLLSILTMRPPTVMRTYVDGLRAVSGVLRAEFVYTDIATDILGFRAIAKDTDPYLPLTTYFLPEGFVWELPTASTHPPSAHLLTAPVAFLPLPVAVSAWSWLMLCLLGASYYLLGLTPKAAIGLACLSLLWPPVMTSLAQLTIIWLFGVVVAIRVGRRFGGVALALAAMTKLAPALLILPFLIKRQWSTVAAFAATSMVALGLLLALSPSVVWRYVEVNRTNMVTVADRADNASPIVSATRAGGRIGGAAVVLFALTLIAMAVKRDLTEAILLVNYAIVLLLPIAWIYSPCVLIPMFVWFLKAGPSWRAGLTVVSIYALSIGPLFGGAAALPIALAMVLPGVGFLADERLMMYRSPRVAPS